jgi:hypothetical protein
MGGVSGLERRELVPKPVEIDIQWLSRHVMRDLAMGDYARYLPFPPSRLAQLYVRFNPPKADEVSSLHAEEPHSDSKSAGITVSGADAYWSRYLWTNGYSGFFDVRRSGCFGTAVGDENISRMLRDPYISHRLQY